MNQVFPKTVQGTIYIKIYLLVLINVFHNNTKTMCNIFPDLVLHLFTFICFPLNSYFTKCLDFMKLCTHDFSRIHFSYHAKLFTKLVYNSIFVIVYELFEIIFSRLCLMHTRVMIRSTDRGIQILH